MMVIFMRLVVMMVIVESLMATIVTLKGLVMAMTLILDVEQVDGKDGGFEEVIPTQFGV